MRKDEAVGNPLNRNIKYTSFYHNVFLYHTLVGLQSIVMPCEGMNIATSAGT
jgi:hypothetical protein